MKFVSRWYLIRVKIIINYRKVCLRTRMAGGGIEGKSLDRIV